MNQSEEEKEFIQKIVAEVIDQINNYHLQKWIKMWRSMIELEIKDVLKEKHNKSKK